MGLRLTKVDEKPLGTAEVCHLQESLQVTGSTYTAGGCSREREGKSTGSAHLWGPRRAPLLRVLGWSRAATGTAWRVSAFGR
jgi:hypothetical protein